jgi:hypothetical protein
MRGIAGKAGQAAAAAVVPSITPAAAEKTGAIVRNLFLRLHGLLEIINTHVNVSSFRRRCCAGAVAALRQQ